MEFLLDDNRMQILWYFWKYSMDCVNIFSDSIGSDVYEKIVFSYLDV